MIIKSFLRKKSTKIYAVIIILLIILMLCINTLYSYVNYINQKNTFDNSLIFLESEENMYEDLSKSKLVRDISRVIFFDLVYSDNSIINEYNFSDDNLSSSDLIDNSLDNRVLVYGSDNLSNDEMEIYLLNANYNKKKEYLNNFYQQNVSFSYQNQEYNLQIKNIDKTKNVPYIVISNELFSILMNSDDMYRYTYKMYCSEATLKNKFPLSRILTCQTEEEVMLEEKISKHLNILNILNISVIIFFSIILVIINGNIINDLLKDCVLENKLGFTSKNIRNYLFMRLIVLYCSNFLLAFSITSIGKIIITLIFKTNYIKYNYLIIVYILFMILINSVYAYIKKLELK